MYICHSKGETIVQRKATKRPQLEDECTSWSLKFTLQTKNKYYVLCLFIFPPILSLSLSLSSQCHDNLLFLTPSLVPFLPLSPNTNTSLPLPPAPCHRAIARLLVMVSLPGAVARIDSTKKLIYDGQLWRRNE